jgi:ABC-type sugar transport system ATPase subunit
MAMQTGTASETGNTNRRFLLQVKGVTKRFPGVLALSSVDLEIREGEVHAVVGENGAGKSTLCNIITGIYTPDEGELFWQGNKILFTHPRQALDVGIRMVYQERNLIPFLTGAQNICLGEEETRHGFVDEASILERAQLLRERLGTNVVLDVPINRLPPSSRQMIEIMRQVHDQPGPDPPVPRGESRLHG